ncbi:uncharacterized protein TNCV_5060341 [Trichonephila clavipes]|nr:uncharacterized protein TNCV_5060341 [Trichonephila clavipes]
MWFQHDGVPAHFSADVRSALNTAYPGRWIRRSAPSLVYTSSVDSNEALVARIAVVAGDIREMPGVFANVRHICFAGGEVAAAAWSTTPRSGITELCSEEREFQISPPEHNSVCAT